MLRIALPNKGRLAEDVRGVFADAGLEIRASGERALTASLGGEFEAIFVRSQDIPELVSDGVADAGVTGWDLVCESGRDRWTSDWTSSSAAAGWCSPCARTAASSGSEQLAAGARVPPPSSRGSPRSFFARRGSQVEVVPVSGAAEVAPHLGIADVVVDLTSTGCTLRTNGLQRDRARSSSPPPASSPGPALAADRARRAATSSRTRSPRCCARAASAT